MTDRPWIVSTLVLAALTLALWTDLRIRITPPNLSALSQTPTTPIATTNVSSSTTATAAAVPQVTAIPTAPSGTPIIPRIDYASALGIPALSNVSAKITTVQMLQTESALKISNEFIPKEGTKTPQGLTLSLATFNSMKGWFKSVSLSADLATRAEGLMNTVYHPCCGSVVNPKACDCGHAIGIAGLIKKMVSEGKTDGEILTESNVWLKYFFPRHYVIMAMLQKKLGRSLTQIDYSQKFSSIEAEKPAITYLAATWDGRL